MDFQHCICDLTWDGLAFWGSYDLAFTRWRQDIDGAEAALIRETLAYVVDMVEDEITASADPWEFGVAAFDRLEPPARLAMLAEVGWHLLRETESYPELTTLNEATVAVLFNAIEQGLELEIDCQSD
jgi:hypothetical protein